MAREGAIEARTQPLADQVGEMTLYSSAGIPPDIEHAFGIRFQTQLSDAIRTWVRRPLNEFLDYVYFDTPPMRDARRGDFLRFEPGIFVGEQQDPGPGPLPRHSSREAQKAWRAFLASAAGRDPSRVSMPRDAIVDDAFRAALDRLDAEDSLPRALDARVDARPDELA